MRKFLVEFKENNSGGFYRLGASHYEALEDGGWDTDPPVEGDRYGHRSAERVFLAKTRDNAWKNSRRSFRLATGFRPDDPGCSCCGSPFWFFVQEYDGEDTDRMFHDR